MADPDLQIKGGPGFPYPEIRGEAGRKIFLGVAALSVCTQRNKSA